ncbi:MAG: cysteine desulfurase [Lachnospiraceae bacterium]|nr:cysteine desulfurase [Lachnospiraceae bacterium]
MEIYLDNSATTRAFDEVVEVVSRAMGEDFGNPSSMHQKGVEAERYVKESKEIIAKTLKVQEKEIFYTSGGTESDNWALMGAASANSRAGRHLITTKVEHPAILQTMEYLESIGYEVTYLAVDKQGVIRLEELEREIRQDTILVSIMHVNNEVGAVQPIEEAGMLIKRKNPKTLFHVDAVQSFGKYKIFPKKSKIDMLSVSGHKIHGPKGTGFLYIDEHVKIKPILFGGGQQKGMRSGTENVPGVAGIGKATQLVYRNFAEDVDRLYELKRYFTDEIEKISNIKINGPLYEEGAPHIVSVSFAGVRSEVLLHALEDRGVYVSAGSACASNKHSVSATLKSMGVAQDMLDSTIRFSFSIFTTKDELDYTLKCLNEILPMLRRYTRH